MSAEQERAERIAVLSERVRRLQAALASAAQERGQLVLEHLEAGDSHTAGRLARRLGVGRHRVYVLAREARGKMAAGSG